MLFEPYTRMGMLTRLDAEFAIVCVPPADFPPTWIRKRTGFAWILALGAWMLLLPTSLAAAQSPPAGRVPNASGNQSTTAKTSTAQPPVHHAVRHHHHAKPEAATVAPAPVPPPPLPPAQQPANPATIGYNNGLLTIHAQNSSLVNILVQIQHQTGLVIDGLSHDQRIYGQYGPGNISTTLSALLDGSGYDFVIVGGGSGHAAPRLILSTPGAGSGAMTPPPAVASSEAAAPADGNQEATPQHGNQAEPADPTTPPQPKSPQEIFNELRRMNPQ